MRRLTTILTTILLTILLTTVLATLATTLVVADAAGADARRPTRVLLYGDSLSSESQDPFVDAITRRGRAEVRTGVHGGTAICDWFDRMDSDVGWEPDAVVIEFSGNALTPCMRDATGPAYWTKYRVDTEAVLARFPDARIYLVGTPVNRAAAARHDPEADRLNEMYAAIALADERVEYVPAHRSVLLRGRTYTDVLPCLPAEPCSGSTSGPSVSVNVVRAPDGAHFCPRPDAPAVAGVTGPCPVWSSGAYRFGTAMAQAVAVDFAL